MVSIDIFDASSKIADAISGMSDDKVRKAILMALVSRGLDDLLIDPASISIRSVSPIPEIEKRMCKSG